MKWPLFAACSSSSSFCSPVFCMSPFSIQLITLFSSHPSSPTSSSPFLLLLLAVCCQSLSWRHTQTNRPEKSWVKINKQNKLCIFYLVASGSDGLLPPNESCKAPNLPLDLCGWVLMNAGEYWHLLMIHIYRSLSPLCFYSCARSRSPSPKPAPARLMQLWIQHLWIWVRRRPCELGPAQRWYSQHIPNCIF